MMTTRCLTLALCCLAAGCGSRFNPAETGPKPLPITPPTQQEVQAAIDRGVQFLIKTQNYTGSWGTVRHGLGNIYAPRPGSQWSFLAATTALCVGALIEVDSNLPGADDALRRGEEWLLANMKNIRMELPHVSYSNWTRAYALQAFLRMYKKEPPGPRREAIRAAIDEELRRLFRYQSIEGGWGYYVSPNIPPHGGNVTFLTATVLIALREAQDAGFAIPRKTLDAGLRLLLKQRKPDFAFGYQLVTSPTFHSSSKPGCLARVHTCNMALYVWGDKKTKLTIIKTWLDRLFARNAWLSMARKQQFPHQSYYGIAAYYYYYGHYYAARCIDLLPPEERPHFQDHLAHILLRLQEKDGSWWDWMLYNFHQQYCTGFALMSLQRCLRSVEPTTP